MLGSARSGKFTLLATYYVWPRGAALPLYIRQALSGTSRYAVICQTCRKPLSHLLAFATTQSRCCGVVGFDNTISALVDSMCQTLHGGITEAASVKLQNWCTPRTIASTIIWTCQCYELPGLQQCSHRNHMLALPYQACLRRQMQGASHY